MRSGVAGWCPLKVAEHPFGLAACELARDVLFEWLVPSGASNCSSARAVAVFTAHDLLPRRTTAKQRLSGNASSALRPRCRAQRARAPTLAGPGRERAGHPHSAARARRHAMTTAGPARVFAPPPTRASATQSRPCGAQVTPASSWPAIRSSRWSRIRVPLRHRRRLAPRLVHRRRSIERSETSSSPCSSTGPSSTRAAASCARVGAAFRVNISSVLPTGHELHCTRSCQQHSPLRSTRSCLTGRGSRARPGRRTSSTKSLIEARAPAWRALRRGVAVFRRNRFSDMMTQQL